MAYAKDTGFSYTKPNNTLKTPKQQLDDLIKQQQALNPYTTPAQKLGPPPPTQNSAPKTNIVATPTNPTTMPTYINYKPYHSFPNSCTETRLYRNYASCTETSSILNDRCRAKSYSRAYTDIFADNCRHANRCRTCTYRRSTGIVLSQWAAQQQSQQQAEQHIMIRAQQQALIDAQRQAMH